MCITLGQSHGIFDAGLGTFDAGTTQHSIRFAEQFPIDESEKATTLKTHVEAGIPLKVAMAFSGYTEEEIAKVPDVQPTQPVA